MSIKGSTFKIRNEEEFCKKTSFLFVNYKLKMEEIMYLYVNRLEKYVMLINVE
jgi:hypothetical protein